MSKLKPCPFCKAVPYQRPKELGCHRVDHKEGCFLGWAMASADQDVIFVDAYAEWNRRSEKKVGK